MAKKFAKKIATYAMAATMIGGAVIGSGSTGVFPRSGLAIVISYPLSPAQ